MKRAGLLIILCFVLATSLAGSALAQDTEDGTASLPRKLDERTIRSIPIQMLPAGRDTLSGFLGRAITREKLVEVESEAIVGLSYLISRKPSARSGRNMP